MKLGKVYFYNPCGEKATEMKKRLKEIGGKFIL